MIQRLEVEYSAAARRDLDDLLHLLVENGASVEAALGYVLRIEDRCEGIGDVPNGGRQRDDLRLGLRVVPFEHSAVIAYVVEHGRVIIGGVFYRGRDYEVLLRHERSTDDS
jgi:toxin ParE1/3/4